MEISEDKQGDVLTLSLKGRLDAASSKSTEEKILKLIDAGERRLVIDLSGLAYISSVGLRVLMVVAKKLKTVQGKVALCALQPSVKQVFEIAGFTTIFPILDDRDKASASV
jgi:anti-anti-sigma factor